MKKYIFFAIPFLIAGCSFSNTTQKVKNFTKCYIHNLPAPFWVCYQSSFQSVGKTKAQKMDRLKQEEAFSLGVSDLINKLNAKVSLFLRRIGKDDENTLNRIKASIKNYVVVNALEGKSWYSSKEHLIYVEVLINKDDFKKFLFSQFKNLDTKTLNTAWDETF